MASKKKAKPASEPTAVPSQPSPDRTKIVSILEEIIAWYKKGLPDTVMENGIKRGIMAKAYENLLSRIDELAADYKAFASADITWLLRRFDGLRVLANVKDAPRSGFDFGPWAGDDMTQRELTFDVFNGLVLDIFGPEKDVNEMYDFYHYQAFVRDWRVRLGVQPTTPMLDWMLDKEVVNNRNYEYPWAPSEKAVEAHVRLAAIQREAVVAPDGEPDGEPATTLREFKRLGYERGHGTSQWGMRGDLEQAWERYEAGELDGAVLAAALFKSHFPPHSPIWFPATGDAVPNFVIVSDGSDEWFAHSTNVIFAGSAGFEGLKSLTYSPSPKGVLDLSARHLHEQWRWPASPWCFAGLEAVRGVRELRMNGHGRFFYTIGHAGLLPDGTPRPLRPLVPPGAPLRESLRVLDLSGNHFDNLGVFLEGLVNLDVLYLNDTNITDVHDLACLVHCPRIRTVTLQGTLLDDDLLARLGDDGHLWRDLAIKNSFISS